MKKTGQIVSMFLYKIVCKQKILSTFLYKTVFSQANV